MLLAVLLAAAARGDDGRAIIERARATNGFAAWTERRSEITLAGVQDGGGRTLRATVSERTDPRGEHRTRIDFTAPDDQRGRRMLHVAPCGAPDEYWLWYPTDRRARRVAGNAAGSRQRDEIFFGTDMSYRDLELIVRILQWDANDATSTAEDVPCGERTCTRVTLVPAARKEFPFSRYELFFSREDLLLERVTLYGDAADPVETIRCEGYRSVGRFQTPRSCTIEHAPTHARAVITIEDAAYDPGLSDDLFTVSGLEHR